jgi:hypothetical protein
LVVTLGWLWSTGLLYLSAVCATRRCVVERGERPLRWAVVAV